MNIIDNLFPSGNIFQIHLQKDWNCNLNPVITWINKKQREDQYGKLKFKIPMTNLVATESNWMLEYNHLEGKTMYLPLYTFYEEKQIAKKN